MPFSPLRALATKFAFRPTRLAGVLLGLVALAGCPGAARAQMGFGGGGFGLQQQVGGISVDTNGIVRVVDDKVLKESSLNMRQAVADVKLPAEPSADPSPVSVPVLMRELGNKSLRGVS